MLTGTNINLLTCFKCGHPGCKKHYSTEHGYFSSRPGQPIESHEGYPGLRCKRNHDVLFMFVTKGDHRLVWACPDPACDNTVAYREKPAAVCTKCGAIRYDIQATNQRCAERQNGKRCQGVYGGAFGTFDWTVCGYCGHTGEPTVSDKQIGAHKCQACRGSGWIFARRQF